MRRIWGAKECRHREQASEETPEPKKRGRARNIGTPAPVATLSEAESEYTRPETKQYIENITRIEPDEITTELTETEINDAKTWDEYCRRVNYHGIAVDVERYLEEKAKTASERV